jgi:site-specific recombinase XerD
MRNKIINKSAISLSSEWQSLFTQYQEVHLASRNYRQTTRREYISDINQLLCFLSSAGIGKPQDVSFTHLNQYLAFLDEQKLSGLSRRRKTSSIKNFFEYLTQNDIIVNNFARNLVPPRKESHTPRVLSQDEYKRLQLVVANEPRDAAIVELLLQCGIRLSELTHLTVTDIQLPNKISQDVNNVGTLIVREGKGGRDRILTLNHKVCKALKTWLDHDLTRNNPYLSPNSKNQSHREATSGLSEYISKRQKSRTHTFIA